MAFFDYLTLNTFCNFSYCFNFLPANMKCVGMVLHFLIANLTTELRKEVAK